MEEEQRESQAGWQFKPEDGPAAPQAPLPALEPVSWTASEYIAHHKTAGWFLLLGLGTAALTVGVYLVTGGDVLSSVMIAVAGIIFGVFGARRPQVLEYAVGPQGVHIGPKHYGWDEFKSFAVIDENALRSIVLLPLKRFQPPISMYYALDDEAGIVDVLSACLPIEQRQQDALERLMHKMRF